MLDLKNLMAERIIGQPACARGHRRSDAHLARQADRSPQADRRISHGRHQRRRQDRNGADLAELLYGGGQNLTVINMSEFKEEHKVSMLVGSPPGYVGYGEGGVLTEAVRRRPYSVVLLDEMEKAHPGVQDVFYQVFDKGQLRDGEGRDIDFKNTTIIMTSNAGTDTIAKLAPTRRRCPIERPGGRAAAGTAEGVQAGIPGPRHRRSLFPLVGRDLAHDHQTAARSNPTPHRRYLRDRDSIIRPT